MAVLAGTKPVAHNVPVQSRTLDFWERRTFSSDPGLFLDQRDSMLNWWLTLVEQNVHVRKKSS